MNKRWKIGCPPDGRMSGERNATALEAIASQLDYTNGGAPGKQKPKRPATPEVRASLRTAIDRKCRDCGAADGGAHWRLHIAACPVNDCPLWCARPLPKLAPNWIVSRNPSDLPADWTLLPFEAAIAAIRAIGAPVTGLPDEAMAFEVCEGPWHRGPAVSPRSGVAGELAP